MVGKRALLALCAAVLVHAGAIASTCDDLRQDLNQAVMDGEDDGYLCVSYMERLGVDGLHERCLDYTDAMMRLALTVQELQVTRCEYQIAPSDAKRTAWVYTRYMKLTTSRQ